MQSGNKLFLAIIVGAVIIGGCVHLALRQGNNSSIVIPGHDPEYRNTETARLPAQAGTLDFGFRGNDTAILSASSPKINTVTCGATGKTIITKVIDGDTVVVEGGFHVRLLGIDADEKGYPCYDAAKTRLESLVLGKNVTLEKDKTDKDQYDRYLRYIFIDGKNADTEMVKEGLAVARFYKPDIKYEAEISAAEKNAIKNKTGCKWSGASQTLK